MKIALSQLNYRIGDFDNNLAKIINSINRAEINGAELIVFSELAVCGYPPRDFLEFDDFINKCNNTINYIAKKSNIAVIVGTPTYNSSNKGKKLFNSAIFINQKKVSNAAHKTLLPTYDIFDENRYFEPNNFFETIQFKEHNFGMTICEDLWNVDQNPLYSVSPMEKLKYAKPDLIINIAASPFDYLHTSKRKQIISDNAKKYKVPIIYVNQVGAQTELIFDGGSMVADSEGNIVSELKYFEEDFKIIDTSLLKGNNMGKQTYSLQPTKTQTAEIYDALVLGIKDYFEKMNLKTAILGLSGGIDSALVLELAVKALGSENVRAVLMPSQFSSEGSVTDAIEIAENLEVKYDIINIEKPYNTFTELLSEQFEGLPFNIAEENIQARSRAVILMALSNKFGNVLLNTSNKSEIAVGYGTLYGDMCGGLSVIGDIYKTQVYDLVKYINRNAEIIPTNIINKPPSAELRPNQKDTDSLPDYDILDLILYQYIELRKSPADIIKGGYDSQLVEKVLKLVNTNEYKRHQTAPILRVSPKAFGVGRRMPIVGKYLS